MTKMKKICGLLTICVIAVIFLAGFKFQGNTSVNQESEKLAQAYTIGYYAGIDSAYIESIGTSNNSISKENILSYKTAKAAFEKDQSWDNAIELYNAVERIMEELEQEK